MSIAKRVAVEARRLASECVEGRAPKLIAGNFKNEGGQSCALGWILRRSGRGDPSPWERFYDLSDELELFGSDEDHRALGEAWHLVLEGNNAATEQERPLTVVFPLLALADALEESP